MFQVRQCFFTGKAAASVLAASVRAAPVCLWREKHIREEKKYPSVKTRSGLSTSERASDHHLCTEVIQCDPVQCVCVCVRASKLHAITHTAASFVVLAIELASAGGDRRRRRHVEKILLRLCPRSAALGVRHSTHAYSGEEEEN